MDCFYAAIEMRDNPELIGQPIAVGGQANSRGVLCTCNYEARKFGIHSAMASAQAIKKCPQLVILPVAMDKYRLASMAIRDIFFEYTDLVEPLSLDEAYLDVSECKQLHGSATLIAQEIRDKIFDSQKITASAGIASNKFLAKIASDINKPNGQFVITPDAVDQFIFNLPIEKVFGIGKVTAAKLKAAGIHFCGDIQQYSLIELSRKFGNFGEHLYYISRGIDDREVSPNRIRKSLSVEETYARDLASEQECIMEFPALVADFNRRMDSCKDKTWRDIKTLFVKIKYNDFTSTTIQSGSHSVDTAGFIHLFRQRYSEKPRPVRLLGIGVRFQEDEQETHTFQQLEMDFERVL